MANITRIGFIDGVKASYDPSIVPPEAIWRAYNVRSDQSGILRLREGSSNFNESLGTEKIQGMESAFGDILAVWNRGLYRFTQDGSAARIGTTAIGTSNKDHYELIKWTRDGKEITYIFGRNGIYETDGSTLSTITPYTPQTGEEPNMIRNADGTLKTDGGPATAKYAVLRASLSQRMAVAGVESAPNTVYLSAPLDATYWPADQIIQLPADGSVITGLTNWYNALIIFRDTDIWAFFGTDLSDPSASLVLQDGSVGCVANRTIAHVPDLGVVFLGPDNVYSLQGVSGVENQAKAVPIGDDIANLLREAMEFGLDTAAAVYYNREYRLSFPQSVSDERVFRLRIQHNLAWFLDTGPRSESFLIHDRQLFGSYVNRGLLQRITDESLYDDTFNNQKEAIRFFVAFRREDLQPGPARIKRIFLYTLTSGRKGQAQINHFGPVFNSTTFNADLDTTGTIEEGTTQHFDITVVVDGNEFVLDDINIVASRLSSLELTGNEPVRVYEARIRPSLKGHFTQLRITAKEPGELIALLGYGIDYAQKGRVRGIRQGVTNNKDW